MEGLYVYASAMPSIWKRVRLEILGPFSPASEGNRYVVFAVDPFTFWTEARPLKDNSPDQVAAFVFSLFGRFGKSELRVVGQKMDFCQNLATSLKRLLESQQRLFGGDNPTTDATVTLSRHGAEQIFSFPELGVEAGKTIAGMSFDHADPQANVAGADITLSPSEAALFVQSDPVNPIPKHPAFTKIAKHFRQRLVNHTNLGSDFLRFISGDPVEWDTKLDFFLHNLRTAVPICNAGYSAFHLMHGRNPVPLTGSELMMRSLKGVKSVLAMFSPLAKPAKPEKKARRTADDLSDSGSDDVDTRCADIEEISLHSSSRKTGRPQELRRGTRKSPRRQPALLQETPVDGDANPLVSNKSASSRGTSSSAWDVDDQATSSVHDVNGERLEGTPAKSASKHDKHSCKSSKKEVKVTSGKRRRKRGNILKVRCPQCPNTYVTCAEELELHLRCHGKDTVSGDRIFTCPECGKICKIWLNMVRHLSQHQDISSFRKLPEECYKCNVCAKVFKVPEGLREHVKVVHQGQKRFECHICQEKFKVFKTKMRHMDLKHANITYACDLCPYTTKVRRNHRLHTESHKRKQTTTLQPPVAPLAENGEQNERFSAYAAVAPPADTLVQVSGSSQLALFHRLHAAGQSGSVESTPSRLAASGSSDMAGNIQGASQLFYLSSSGQSVVPIPTLQVPHNFYTVHFPSCGTCTSGVVCEPVSCSFPEGLALHNRDLSLTFGDAVFPPVSF